MNHIANPELYQSILSKLESIPSHHPFSLLFYGSRERGDSGTGSDYNFYLIASPMDQLKTSFIEDTARALHDLEEEAPVNLIAGDLESFRMRMQIFEPSVVHLMEMGSIFFGGDELKAIQKEWETLRLQQPPLSKLKTYLEKRLRFYRRLEPKSPKEEISRLERVLLLTLQSWVCGTISDISLAEIYSLDIPSRIVKLIPTLYHKEMTEDILEILQMYEEVVRLRVLLRNAKQLPEEFLDSIQTKMKTLREEEAFFSILNNTT